MGKAWGLCFSEQILTFQGPLWGGHCHQAKVFTMFTSAGQKVSGEEATVTPHEGASLHAVSTGNHPPEAGEDQQRRVWSLLFPLQYQFENFSVEFVQNFRVLK